jgi:periplasmic protein CpxP/Spy
MNSDLMTTASMAALRAIAFVLSNRSLLKSLVFSTCVLLFAAIFIMQPLTTQAQDFSNISNSPEQIMSQLKERLNLTEDQETKVRPIIQESIKKRNEIIQNGAQAGKKKKSALQELGWSTDMQLGNILTEQQMKDYQEFQEEQSEKTQNNDMPRSRGGRTGGMRGF